MNATITLDKQFTPIAKAKQVRADIKEFKSRYTAGDLARTFEETFHFYDIYATDVINITGEAFTECGGDTQFRIVMLLKGCTKIYEIQFFTNLNLEYSTDPLLWSVNIYEKKRA